MIFVVDYYEYPEGEIIYAGESAEEAQYSYDERYADTDGECELALYYEDVEPEICKELKERISW